MNLMKKVFSGFVAALLCVSLSGCNWWGEDDKPTPPAPTPAASGYEITVFDNGNAQPTVTAESYSADSDALSYQVKAKDKNSPNQTGSAKGTWVVKHKSWKAAAQEKRYQVTLYSGSKAVGTWTVHGFSTDSQSVLLFPSEGGEVLRVCGNVVVKSLKSGTAAKATSKVSLYNGDSVVYELELGSSLPVGKHLEGLPADGSGRVWIWGNYKEVNFVR